MTEVADRKVWIFASVEVLREIQEGWSRPVQAHADDAGDGSWNMTLREYHPAITAEQVENLRLKHTDMEHEQWDCCGFGEGLACCIDSIRPDLEALIAAVKP